jgi:hypothetical protein
VETVSADGFWAAAVRERVRRRVRVRWRMGSPLVWANVAWREVFSMVTLTGRSSEQVLDSYPSG